MKLGLALPNAGPLASPANLVQAATEAERVGIDSVWVLDRMLRPRGAALPDFYARVFDPIETLAYVGDGRAPRPRDLRGFRGAL